MHAETHLRSAIVCALPFRTDLLQRFTCAYRLIKLDEFALRKLDEMIMLDAFALCLHYDDQVSIMFVLWLFSLHSVWIMTNLYYNGQAFVLHTHSHACIHTFTHARTHARTQTHLNHHPSGQQNKLFLCVFVCLRVVSRSISRNSQQRVIAYNTHMWPRV